MKNFHVWYLLLTLIFNILSLGIGIAMLSKESEKISLFSWWTYFILTIGNFFAFYIAIKG